MGCDVLFMVFIYPSRFILRAFRPPMRGEFLCRIKCKSQNININKQECCTGLILERMYYANVQYPCPMELASIYGFSCLFIRSVKLNIPFPHSHTRTHIHFLL